MGKTVTNNNNNKPVINEIMSVFRVTFSTLMSEGSRFDSFGHLLTFSVFPVDKFANLLKHLNFFLLHVSLKVEYFTYYTLGTGH